MGPTVLNARRTGQAFGNYVTMCLVLFHQLLPHAAKPTLYHT